MNVGDIWSSSALLAMQYNTCHYMYECVIFFIRSTYQQTSCYIYSVKIGNYFGLLADNTGCLPLAVVIADCTRRFPKGIHRFSIISDIYRLSRTLPKSDPYFHNIFPADRDTSRKCKQPGSRRETEQLDVPSRSKLFEIRFRSIE